MVIYRPNRCQAAHRPTARSRPAVHTDLGLQTQHSRHVTSCVCGATCTHHATQVPGSLLPGSHDVPVICAHVTYTHDQSDAEAQQKSCLESAMSQLKRQKIISDFFAQATPALNTRIIVPYHRHGPRIGLDPACCIDQCHSVTTEYSRHKRRITWALSWHYL